MLESTESSAPPKVKRNEGELQVSEVRRGKMEGLEFERRADITWPGHGVTERMRLCVWCMGYLACLQLLGLNVFLRAMTASSSISFTWRLLDSPWARLARLCSPPRQFYSSGACRDLRTMSC